MKNWIIAFLAAALLLAASIAYRRSQTGVYFSRELACRGDANPLGDRILCLYLFMQKNVCPSCVDMIAELNEFRNPVVVRVVIPENEMAEAESIRRRFGIRSEIVSAARFRSSLPRTVPALVGATQQGEILIVMPAVAGSVRHIRDYIMTFYATVFAARGGS